MLIVGCLLGGSAAYYRDRLPQLGEHTLTPAAAGAAGFGLGAVLAWVIEIGLFQALYTVGNAIVIGILVICSVAMIYLMVKLNSRVHDVMVRWQMRGRR